jgi:serine protease Do
VYCGAFYEIAQGGGGLFEHMNSGETLVAYITTSDEALPDGSYYRAFSFTGQTDDTLTISLASIDFDAVLLLADSSGELLNDGIDNNSGGNCNAHLNYVVPVDGDYLILATSNYPTEIGEFQVSLSRGVRPPASGEPCRGFFATKGTLHVGDSVTGQLGPPEDSKLGPSYYQVWDLAVPQGQTVTVDLASDEFDARLTLYRGFRTPLDANDDGGGKCNARLVLTGGPHPHRILLTTGKEDETGAFQLTMVDTALPVVAESECMP